MNKKRCLVLGGNGFIGSHVLEKLNQQQYNIISFDRELPVVKIEGIQYIVGDFKSDKDLSIAVEKADVVLHLISTINPSLSIIKPLDGYTIDTVQTIKILEILRENNGQLIFASSGGTVYGEQEHFPIKEESICKPINHYGNTKLTIENIIRMYNHNYKMNNKILRISNPYGLGQDYHKGVGVISAFINKILNNETVEIWGDGNIIRDYIYIDDLCQAFVDILNYRGQEEVFNIGSGKGYSLNEILNIIEKIHGKPIKKIYLDNRIVDVQKVVLDITKVKQELNFKPKTSFKEGLEKYYRIIKK